MTAKDLLKRVRENPFVPFRMVVSEGAAYDVRHPDQIMVRRDSAVIGLPGQSDDFIEDTALVDLIYVIRLEPIPGSKKAKGNASNAK